MTKIHTNLLFSYTIIISRVKYFCLLDHRGLISLVTLHASSVKLSKFFHKFPRFKCSLHIFNVSPHFPSMTPDSSSVFSSRESFIPFKPHFSLRQHHLHFFFRLSFLWLNYSPNIFLQPFLIIASYCAYHNRLLIITSYFHPCHYQL